MAQLGVMIEAQEGLNWARWRRVVADSERLGFAALRVSDHCQSVFGVEGRESLSSWVALALAAEWTERVQLGTLVSPMTFYVPAVLGRQARAVDELSDGRLIFGVGTGWNAAEHERFGIPFPPTWRERFDLLEAGIARIRQTFAGRDIPFVIGGGGARRTRTIAAREASEWNTGAPDAATFGSMSAALDERCRELGRDPAEISRSLMKGCLIGRDEADLRERALRMAEVVPRLPAGDADAALAAARERWFVGTPAEVAAQMRPFAEAGVGLFMLQHFLLDEPEVLELLAGEVAPALA
ncbi:MAG TPA: LLM class flavin-dependent oxidoreductase [Candidatus Dormibacteraeota bacterium]|jgi:alkanesulfonate monooxygenase SsuD/methylene tetrahydromethanopterin reductase-like flavin-dependent oxidoreductase (luciferase family)